MTYSTLVGVMHFKVIERNVEEDSYISEALLEAHAPRFVEVMKGAGYIDDVPLLDVEFETFHVFTEGMSRKNKPEYALLGSLDTNPFAGQSWTPGMPLLKLHRFAGDYSIPGLGTDVECGYARIIALRGRGGPRMHGVGIKVIYTLDEIEYIYEHTAADFPLREIVVKGICAAGYDMDDSPG
jgi:hypothetical protein